MAQFKNLKDALNSIGGVKQNFRITIHNVNGVEMLEAVDNFDDFEFTFNVARTAVETGNIELAKEAFNRLRKSVSRVASWSKKISSDFEIEAESPRLTAWDFETQKGWDEE